mgnify:CR=1 FL=1
MLPFFSFSYSMFFIGAVIFTVFTFLYCFVTTVVIYNLKRFTLPNQPAPTLAIRYFLGLSLFLWLTALFFLILFY